MKKRLPYLLLITCTVLLVWALAGTPVQADMIKGETALGGMSKALNDFYDRGGELYSAEDLRILSAAMQLENGCNSDRCLLLTGSVILNRAWYCRWAPNTIRGVLLQGYKSEGPQQYATSTILGLDTVEVTPRVLKLAKQLLIGGPICPRNVIYQAMFMQGSGLYAKEDTEYFCLE